MRRTGFKSRGKPLKRGGPLRRFTPLVSRTKLARTPLLRPGTSGVEESTGRGRLGSGRPSRGHRIERDSAAIVRERSGGVCEIQLEGWLRGEHLGFIRRKAAELRVVDGQSEPTDEDIERLAPYTDLTVGGPSDRPTWCQLLRGTQGKPAAILDAGVIEDGSMYGGIEYSYFIDLDAQRFLAYEGARGRLIGSWPLAELPDEKTFLKTVDPSEVDDD